MGRPRPRCRYRTYPACFQLYAIDRRHPRINQDFWRRRHPSLGTNHNRAPLTPQRRASCRAPRRRTKLGTTYLRRSSRLTNIHHVDRRPRQPPGRYQTIERVAGLAGLDPTGLGTHAGRGTVMTVMYAEGGLDLADIARHVGHADAATTAGYVRNLGKRPASTARRAAELLDPTLHVS